MSHQGVFPNYLHYPPHCSCAAWSAAQPHLLMLPEPLTMNLFDALLLVFRHFFPRCAPHAKLIGASSDARGRVSGVAQANKFGCRLLAMSCAWRRRAPNIIQLTSVIEAGVAGGKFYLAFVKFLRPRWLKRLARSDVGSTDGVLAISSGRDNEEPPLGTDLLSSGSVASGQVKAGRRVSALLKFPI